MLTCIIVDDEPSAVSVLKNYVAKTPFLTLAGTAGDPLEAIKIMEGKQIDLVFLDVQMPHLSGIDFMKMLQGKTQVILTTAYSEFAVEGFENEALDYLLKPIAFDRFLKASQRALNSATFSPSDWQPVEKEDDYMFVKTETKGKMLKINFEDIAYVEGLKNYVSIFVADERIITYTSIKALEEKLPSYFMRVHKSYIVSLKKVRAVDGNQILLHNMKAYVPLGETYRNTFFNSLKILGGKK